MFLVVLAAAGTFSAACGAGLVLPDVNYTNVVDTTTIYALRGTEIVKPSGFDVPNKAPIRTDLGTFDFAFDITTAGTAVLYPAGALRLPAEPGINKTTATFESIIEAPETGYVDTLAVPIEVGNVFVVRSRFYFPGCEFTGTLPRYGKFRVLAINPVVRSLTMEALIDQNCGYRGLQPGAPPN